jgi:hypothetical protein
MMRLSVQPNRLRALLAAGAAVTAFGLAPGAADASTVSAAAGQVTYEGGRSESNHVTIAPWGLSLKVTDTGTKARGKSLSLNVGAGCWRLSATSAACSNGTSGVAFEGGDGDDFLDATLLTSPLTASGGAGDDTILARNGAASTLTCGAGSDGGSADSEDSVAADCEAVALPEPTVDPGTTDPGTTDPGTTDPGTTDPGTTDPGTTDPGTTDPGTTDPGTTDPGAGEPDPDDPGPGDPDDPAPATGNAVPPSIPAQTVGVSASGVASVLVACPADSGGCSGTVAIELPQPAKKNRRAKTSRTARRGAALTLGRTRFKARAGTTKTVRVHLSKRGRRRILRGRRGRRARIVVTTRSADGKATVISQDVTLRPRPRASGRKARRA